MVSSALLQFRNGGFERNFDLCPRAMGTGDTIYIGNILCDTLVTLRTGVITVNCCLKSKIHQKCVGNFLCRWHDKLTPAASLS